jgi:hypothetical protein
MFAGWWYGPSDATEPMLLMAKKAFDSPQYVMQARAVLDKGRPSTALQRMVGRLEKYGYHCEPVLGQLGY